jgi:hypothetical protein
VTDPNSAGSPDQGPDVPDGEGVSPGPESGLSPAPEPSTPTSDPGRPTPSAQPVGSAPTPAGRKGCLGGAAAAIVALSGLAGGLGYVAVRIWSGWAS